LARSACPVSGSNCAWRGALGFTTGVSGPSQNQSVRSHPENSASLRADQAWWRVRSGATGRIWSTTSLDSDRTLALSRPVVAWSASGHTLPKSVTFRDHWKSNERNSKRDTWRASREVTLVRPDAGRVWSIRLACPINTRRAASRA
jgi:hypothetical protein